jgi:predicted RNA binding protein YcfA (HicA-like mRNA interferase family)
MSQRLPAVKPKEVLRALGRAGFFIHHTSGSHHVLKHPGKPNLRRVALALRDFEFVGAPSFGVGRAGLLSKLPSSGHEKSNQEPDLEGRQGRNTQQAVSSELLPRIDCSNPLPYRSFLWRGLQPVGFWTWRGQNPQAVACATDAPVCM